MTRSKLQLTFAAAALALALGGAALAPAALAQGRTADSLRATGQVGEQGDGLLACVQSCDAQTRQAVEDINARRAQAYREIAQRTGVTEAAAGQAAAQKVIASLPSGQFYKPMGGGWTKK
jgi:uncharacterized protein YdbL (DUF1318 family)